MISEKIKAGVAQNKSYFYTLSKHIVGSKRRLQLETPTELNSFRERGEAQIFLQSRDRIETIFRGTTNAYVLKE